LRIAILTTDGRSDPNFPASDRPHFGSAVSALLEGFAMLAGEGKQNIDASRLDRVIGRPHPQAVPAQAPTCDLRPAIFDFSSSISHLPSSVPEIHVISCLRSPLPSPEKLAENIWFHPVVVPRWGWLRSGYAGCAWEVRRKLETILPDIVHAQGTERDCAIAGALSGFRNILTIHGNLRSIRERIGLRPGSPMWLQSYLEQLVIPRFHAHICISNYSAALLPRSVKHKWVIPNAVNSSFFEIAERREKPEAGSPKSEAASPPSDLPSPISHLRSPTFPPSAFRFQTSPPLLLVPAAIEPWKNQVFFLKAIDSVAEDIPIQILFVGADRGGAYSDIFHRMVAERPWCRYGGMLGRGELIQEMLSATMLVLPSIEENCPMVILEAMAAGVPVAASNAGGIPDLVHDGKNGLLFDPNNAGSIAGAVRRLLTRPSLLKQVATTARINAEEKYHPMAIASQHVEIYKNELNKHTRDQRRAL
jgi:glycosyltransferase involved in cell wall biosynthesis